MDGGEAMDERSPPIRCEPGDEQHTIIFFGDGKTLLAVCETPTADKDSGQYTYRTEQRKNTPKSISEMMDGALPTTLDAVNTLSSPPIRYRRWCNGHNRRSRRTTGLHCRPGPLLREHTG